MMRGPYIGLGIVTGERCRIYTDLDRTDRLFAIPLRRDAERYVPRRSVTFIREPKESE